jgi:hypothetical protein
MPDQWSREIFRFPSAGYDRLSARAHPRPLLGRAAGINFLSGLVPGEPSLSQPSGGFSVCDSSATGHLFHNGTSKYDSQTGGAVNYAFQTGLAVFSIYRF